MSGFLTEDELYTLTGYKRRKDRVRELTRMGIPFLTNRFGDPVVDRGWLRQNERPAIEPKLGAIR
jgi:hypothetical protein